MNKEERAERKRREDQALNRVLWWFGGAVLLEFFLLLLNRFYINLEGGTSLAYTLAVMLRAVAWISLAAAVGFGVWWWLRRKKSGATFVPGALTVAAAVLFACAFIASVLRTVGVQFLYVSVPAAAVLALIYYLYQREFFLVALQGGIALFAMWCYRKLIFLQEKAAYVMLGLCAFAVIGLGVVTFLLQRQDGKLGKRRILAKKANYALLYVAGAVTLCALLAALLLGATAAYWALLLVVAWLFGVAVYYTVRLM